MACILFVDDDIFTLETYSRIFTLLGHQTLLSETAEQALEIAKDHKPDLIVVDMRLQGMDGLQLIKQLKAHPQTAHIPVVMVSAYSDAYAIQAKEVGAVHYLSKPIHPEKLLEYIEPNRDD